MGGDAITSVKLEDGSSQVIVEIEFGQVPKND